MTTPTAESVLAAKGHQLKPAARALLESALASTRPNAHLLPVAEARANFEADFAALGPGPEVSQVEDLSVAVDGGAIPARAYRPGPGRLPIIVYLHGGGWLMGSIESHDVVTRWLANATGAVVLSVGYRRGPEHRFPTATLDSYAAVVWAAMRAEELGIDSQLLAIAGDSAGATLATATAMLARDRGEVNVLAQVLAYPVTTTNLDIGFDTDYEGYFLYRDELQWHQDNYLREPKQRNDPLVSPLDGDLRGLCEALIITAQCDPLHRQGELYAERLREAGVPVEHQQYQGMVHGFLQVPSLLDDGAAAIELAAAYLRRVFGSAG